MQSFYCKTQLFFGPDALNALQTLQAKRVMVVTDSFFEKNGMADRIASMVPGSTAEVFSGVTPDPTAALAARGCAQLAGFDPDVVIALGGGSSMDCAKAMVCFAERRPLFVAIPTTSGSGSEVTSFSILTHEGIKYPLIDPAVTPDWAILDDTLVAGLPKTLVADTGFDVISHALEAVAATGAGVMSDALAFAAFRQMIGHLQASFEGDISVRGRLHAAATLAGLAFDQAGLGLCHALSHALGGQFHVPHGRLNAILLPEVVRLNAAVAADRYAALASTCAIGGATEQLTVRALIARLCQLRSRLHMPQTLTQAGVSAERLREAMSSICRAAQSDPCVQTNPIQPDAAQICRLLEACT